MSLWIEWLLGSINKHTHVILCVSILLYNLFLTCTIDLIKITNVTIKKKYNTIKSSSKPHTSCESQSK